MSDYFKLRRGGDGVIVSGLESVEYGARENGVYAWWRWDGERFELGNDGYGFYPIYILKMRDGFAVSPSVGKLLEFSEEKKLDSEALAVFLRLGWFIGEDTAFESIRALPAGAIFEWEGGVERVKRSGIEFTERAVIGEREARKVYADLFSEAMGRRLYGDKRRVVPLSGGCDSRHILLEMVKRGERPEVCVTLEHPPPRPDEDVRIAKMVCERLGQKHLVIRQTGRAFEKEIRKNELTGYAALEHGWFVPLGEIEEIRGADVYDGIGGGVLSAGLFLTGKRLELVRRGDWNALAEELMKPEGYLGAILSREFAAVATRQRAKERIIEELEKHRKAANPITAFYFMNRTRRCIAVCPYRLLPSDVRVITPFLDEAVVRFLMSLSPELLLDHRFHTMTIAEAYPEFADLPYESKNKPPKHDGAYYRRYALDILSNAFTSRRCKLTRLSFSFTRALPAAVIPHRTPTVAYFGELAVFLQQLERIADNY